MVTLNGKETQAVLDTGATVDIVNAQRVHAWEIRPGRQIKVRDFRGVPHLCSDWCSLSLTVGDAKVRVSALVLNGLPYEFLIGRETMRKCKLNIHYDDSLSFGDTAMTVIREDTCGKGVVGGRLETWEDVRRDFPNVVTDSDYPRPVKGYVVDFEITPGPVISRKPYQLSRQKIDWLVTELAKMEKHGIIRKTNSPYGSPITLAPKADGSWRLCTDYRAINARTELASWPLPRIDDIIAETGGCRIFSNIDLLKGFWQQALSEDTKKYSAFVTPVGSFEYNVNPFGWKNSPKVFQRMMDEVLEGHRRYCRWYIDDILIFSRTPVSLDT